MSDHLYCDIRAEQSVLGGLMLDNGRFPDVAEVLSPEDFDRAEHRLIAEALWSLDAAQSPCDLVTVEAEMERRETLTRIGGLGYLGTLAKDTPSAANIVAYARLVRAHAVRRAVADVAAAVQKRSAEDRDAAAVLDYAQAQIMSLAEHRAGGGPRLVGQALGRFIETLDKRSNHDGAVTGVATGFEGLDAMTTGLHPGQLVIVAGRPSMGKSTLAVNMAEHVVLENAGAAVIFSLEMSEAELVERMVASRHGVSLTRLRKGELEDRHWPRVTAAVEALNRANLHIDESGALSVNEVRARARAIHRRTPLSMILVDYLQLMQGDGENQTQIISGISRGLKALAKELHCPVVALSQLNREVDKRRDKRPLMSDLRESGAIERDADLVMFIYRDEVYTRDECACPGLAELILAKQRNGPTGTVPLRFEGHYCRFRDTNEEIGHPAAPQRWTGGFAG